MSMEKRNVEGDSSQKILPMRSLTQLSFATLLSRILGQMRATLWASLLATSVYADSFYIALKLPNMLRAYFAEGAMNSAFVLFYSRLLQKDATIRRNFIKKLIFILFLFLIVLTVGVMFFAPYIAKFYYVFSSKTDKSFISHIEYTAMLIRVAFPYLFLISFVALIASVLQSHGIFKPMGFSPVVFNVVHIIFALFFYFFWADKNNGKIAYLLAVVFVIAGVVQLLYMLWSLRLLRNVKKDDQPKKDEFSQIWDQPKLIKEKELNLKNFFLKFSPITFSSMVHHINIFLIDPIAFSLGGGAVATLFYSNRLLELPLGLFVFPISMVALPNILKLLQQNKNEELRESLIYAYSLMMLFLFPVVVTIIYYRYEIVFIVFRLGSFSEHDVKLTSQTFFFHAFSIPFLALYRLTSTVFYAHQNVKKPLYASFIALFLSLSLAYGLTRFFPMVEMVALSSSLAVCCSSLFLLWSVKKTLNISLFVPLLKKALFYFFVGILPFALAQVMTKILHFAILGALSVMENIWLEKLLTLGELLFFFTFFLLFYLLFLRVLEDNVLINFISSLKDRGDAKDGSVKYTD